VVFAVQCPNPKCRKYMLVEDHDRNRVVACLLCKTAIKVGGGPVSERPAQFPSSPSGPSERRP
jgi:hypothetical protein